MRAPRRCRSHAGGAWQEPLPEGVERRVGLCMPLVSEGEGDQRGGELGVPPGTLDEPGSDASGEQLGSVGRPQGRESDAHCGAPGTVWGLTAGALDTRATHGRGSRRAVLWIAPRGGTEPGRVPVGCPGRAEQREGLCRQGDVAVCGALAAVDRDLEALAIDGRALQGEGCREPQASAGDGGAGDLVVHGGGGREEPPDLFPTEDGGETGGGVRAKERAGVPGALEDVRGETAPATGAEAPGRWGEAVDVVPMQAGVLQRRCGEQGGRLVGERREQASCTDLSVWGTRSLATELQCGHHVLTQWGHEISPCGR
jgi:hypothetical protein